MRNILIKKAIERVVDGYQPCSLDLVSGGFIRARAMGLVDVVNQRWVPTIRGRQWLKDYQKEQEQLSNW